MGKQSKSLSNSEEMAIVLLNLTFFPRSRFLWDQLALITFWFFEILAPTKLGIWHRPR